MSTDTSRSLIEKMVAVALKGFESAAEPPIIVDSLRTPHDSELVVGGNRRERRTAMASARKKR